jgi:hypothetical protein
MQLTVVIAVELAQDHQKQRRQRRPDVGKVNQILPVDGRAHDRVGHAYHSKDSQHQNKVDKGSLDGHCDDGKPPVEGKVSEELNQSQHHDAERDHADARHDSIHLLERNRSQCPP